MKWIFRIGFISVAVVAVLIISNSIKHNVELDYAAKSAGAQSSISSVSENNLINPSSILECIRNNDFYGAEEQYNCKKKEWENLTPKDVTKQLEDYFDTYFELKRALTSCTENKVKIEDAQRYLKDDSKANEFFKKANAAYKFIEETKNSDIKKLQDDIYKENKFLKGDKQLGSGISNFIRAIGNLESYMEANQKVHAEIPAFDMLKSIYHYDLVVNKDDIKKYNKDFVNLTRKYEDCVIKNRYEGVLTQNDATVLCLRANYLLLDAADINENVRKEKSKTIGFEIERLMDEYKDYINSNGQYKDEYRYLDRVKKYGEKLETSVNKTIMDKLMVWDKKQGTADDLIKDVSKLFGNGEIPNLTM